MLCATAEDVQTPGKDVVVCTSSEEHLGFFNLKKKPLATVVVVVSKVQISLVGCWVVC